MVREGRPVPEKTRRRRRKRCPECNELKTNLGSHIWHAHGSRALKRYHKAIKAS